MKKTMIALVALSGLAMADTTTSYDLFASTDGWTHSSVRYASNVYTKIDTTKKTFENVSGNWAQSYGLYTFGSPIELTDAGDQLDFSFNLISGTNDAAITVTFVDTVADKTVTVGMGEYAAGSGAVKYGHGPVLSLTTPDSTQNFSEMYTFQDTERKNMTVDGTIGTLSTDKTPMKIEGSITMTPNGEFVASFGENYTVKLGKAFTLDKVVILLDGQKDANIPSVSDLTLTHTDVTPAPATPEPATATLSLLALAGLAARRRRH